MCRAHGTHTSAFHTRTPLKTNTVGFYLNSIRRLLFFIRSSRELCLFKRDGVLLFLKFILVVLSIKYILLYTAIKCLMNILKLFIYFVFYSKNIKDHWICLNIFYLKLIKIVLAACISEPYKSRQL